ncbi:DUF4349 domain-containing protein [Leptospira sp. WS92.C1]
MNKTFKKGLWIALAVFATLFLFRLLYGYLSSSGNTGHTDFQNGDLIRSRESLPIKQNIASKKIKYDNPGSTITKSVDQKYEKIATIESQSADIEDDEKKIRDLVNTTGSIIQYENISGLKRMRDRVIKIAVGVPPEKFDDLVNEFKKIGKTLLLTIDKKDKTNEYKNLQAKKESILKIRNSLTGLKNKGGRIDEYISLENRILEIEEEIQKLGISLGEYDSENEFCTVLLTIYENQASGEIGLIHRIKVALEWTIKYYLLLAFSLLFVVLLIHYSFPLWEKIRNLVLQKLR